MNSKPRYNTVMFPQFHRESQMSSQPVRRVQIPPRTLSRLQKIKEDGKKLK